MHYSLARFPPCLYKYVAPPDAEASDPGDPPDKPLRGIPSRLSLRRAPSGAESSPLLRHRPSALSLRGTDEIVCALPGTCAVAGDPRPAARIYQRLWERVSTAVASTPVYFQALLSSPRRNYPELFARPRDVLAAEMGPMRQITVVADPPRAGRRSASLCSLRDVAAAQRSERRCRAAAAGDGGEGGPAAAAVDRALAAAMTRAFSELAPGNDELPIVNVDALHCPLCFDVFSTIQPLPCCGSWSCEFCLQHWVYLHKTCPFCRASVGYSDICAWSRETCVREDAAVDPAVFRRLVERCYGDPVSDAKADDATLCEESAKEPPAKTAYFCKDLSAQKRALQDFQLVVHQHILDSLQVSCIYAGHGCAWTGERRRLRRHLEQDCSRTRELSANEKGYMTIDITDMCGGAGRPAEARPAGPAGSAGLEAAAEAPVEAPRRGSVVSLLLSDGGGVPSVAGDVSERLSDAGADTQHLFNRPSSAQSLPSLRVQHEYLRRQRGVIFGALLACMLFPLLVLVINLKCR